MNILLVGERQDTRRIVQLLLEKSKHRLERKSLKNFPEPDLEAYDMVLVDGAGVRLHPAGESRAMDSEARRRYPHLPVAVMNNVGPQLNSEAAETHESGL